LCFWWSWYFDTTDRRRAVVLYVVRYWLPLNTGPSVVLGLVWGDDQQTSEGWLAAFDGLEARPASKIQSNGGKIDDSHPGLVGESLLGVFYSFATYSLQVAVCLSVSTYHFFPHTTRETTVQKTPYRVNQSLHEPIDLTFLWTQGNIHGLSIF
jgi:hypothetical protein